MEDKVFEVDELAVDPQRGAGVGEILALEEAASDLGTGDALVEQGERGSRLGNGLEQALDGQIAEIVDTEIVINNLLSNSI